MVGPKIHFRQIGCDHSSWTTLEPFETTYYTWEEPLKGEFLHVKTSKAQNDLPDALPLHGVFKNEGYQTLAYGKIFHVKNDFIEHWSSIDMNYKQNDYQNPDALYRHETSERGEYGKKGVAFAAADVPDDAYSDGKITKKAIKKFPLPCACCGVAASALCAGTHGGEGIC